MGVKLGQLINKMGLIHYVKPEFFSGKIVAVDVLPTLYEMLAMIRDKRGLYLVDRKGRVTSHLVGLFRRICRMLILDIRPIFIFDGPPHPLKAKELEKRKREKEKFQKEFIKAVIEGRYEEAMKLGKRAMFVNDEMIRSARELIRLMGLPIIDAPHDAEAQAAYIVAKGDAYVVSTRDWDALLYGSLRIVMDLKLSPQPYYIPRLYYLREILEKLSLTREQLIDLAILLGTDFNPDGFEGIGIKKAYRLIKNYGSLENLIKLGIIKWKFDVDWRDIKEMFLNPPVKENYEIVFKEPNYEGVIRFLVEEYNFNKIRVSNELSEVRKKLESRRAKQASLSSFFGFD